MFLCCFEGRGQEKPNDKKEASKKTKNLKNLTSLTEAAFSKYNFVPISPIYYKGKLKLMIFKSDDSENLVAMGIDTAKIKKDNVVDIDADHIKMDNDFVLRALPNVSMSTSIETTDTDGNVSFLGNGVSTSVGTYKIRFEYAHWIEKQVLCGGGMVRLKVGIGIRLIATITTTKSKLNITSLPQIGIHADAKTVSGKLEIERMGIEGSAIASLTMITPDISQNSIQTILQSFAAIKAKLYDNIGVDLKPEIIGYMAPLDAGMPQSAFLSLYNPTCSDK